MSVGILTALAWAGLILNGLGVVLKILLLSFVQYPRYIKWNRWKDALALVTASIWFAFFLGVIEHLGRLE